MRLFCTLSLSLIIVSSSQADERSDMVAKQRTTALTVMKKCDVPTPTIAETDDLLICGEFPEAKLKTMGEPAQKNYTATLKALKFEMTDNPPKGKVALFFFPSRKQYAAFVGEVVNDRLERDERAHVDARGNDPYVAISVLPGKEPTDLVEEAAYQISVALLQAKAGALKLPQWMEEGFARAMRIRSNPTKYANDRANMRRLASRTSMYKASDVWMPGNDKDKPLLAASLMEYFAFGPQAAKLSKLLAGFRPGENDQKPTVDMALKDAEYDVEKLDASWKKWVATGK